MAGRPKRSFSDEQVQEMSKYALGGCQNNTIATIMDIPMTSLKRHFGKLLTKKRCERKQKLRQTQTDLASTNPAMAIFLGKNELNQTDKREVEHTGPEVPVLSDEERKALAPLASKLKLYRAREGA